MENGLNRLEVIRAEKKRTNKWLTEQFGHYLATVSKWCTNNSQSGLATLRDIAKLLEIYIRVLLNPTLVSEPEIVYMRVSK